MPRRTRGLSVESRAGGLSQTFQRTIADAVAIREKKFAFAIKTQKPEMNPERFIPGRGLLFCDTQAYYKGKDRLVDAVGLIVVCGLTFSHFHSMALIVEFDLAIAKIFILAPIGFFSPVVVVSSSDK